MIKPFLRRTSAWALLAFAYLLVNSPRALGADIIGNEALVTMPSSSISNRWINFRPGNGDVVTLNPPIFSWLYVPRADMRANDKAIWEYQLQIGYTPDLASPVVNVRTKSNMYNFLAPMNPGEVYWRVTYISPNGATHSSTPVFKFTIPQDTPVWDRSMLADTNYLMSKTHPRMVFNASNLPDLRAQIAVAQAMPVAQQQTNILYQTYSSAINAAERIFTQDLSLGTNNFTFDLFVRFDELPAAGAALFSQKAGDLENWSITLNAQSKLSMEFNAGGVLQASCTTTGSWTPVPRQWYHLAFVRNGQQGIIFVDGTRQTTVMAPDFGSKSVAVEYGPIMIGRHEGLKNLKGAVDLIRIAKRARWTGDFAPLTTQPPGSTTDILYLSCDSDNGDTRLACNSQASKVAECVGDAVVSTNETDRIFGKGGVVLDGDGDHILVRDYWKAPFSIDKETGEGWTPVTRQLPVIRNLALVYRLTGTNKYLLGTNLTYATAMLARDAVAVGYVNGSWDGFQGGVVEVLGQVYDWLYEELTPEQRSDIRRAIELNCAYTLKLPQKGSTQGWWSNLGTVNGGGYDLTITDTRVDRSGAGKGGLGHPWANLNFSLQAALAVYSESTDPDLWDLFTLGMNYMIAKDYPFADNNGDGINTGASYAYNAMQRNVPKTMLFHAAFPEAGFNRNPIYTNLVSWFDWMLPVGFQQASWPWGDVGYGRAIVWAMGDGLGYPLTALTGSALAHTHWQNQAKLFTGKVTHIPNVVFAAAANRMTEFNRGPSTSPTAQWFPNGGWLMGATHPPSTPDSFTNGVGFIFQARPAGAAFAHDHVSDLSFQLWAYGSVITDAGGGAMLPYPKLPIAHYSLLVDGRQQAQPLVQSNSFFNQILAYKNTDRYTYFVADGTECYPRKPFKVSGWMYPSMYLTTYDGGVTMPDLTKVRRHFLFMREQGYFVVFDEMSAASPMRFSWLYHVLEDTLTIDTNGIGFEYTSNTQAFTESNPNWPAVKVKVTHIAKPGSVNMLDLSGRDVRKNPITGEDYYELGDPNLVRAHAIWVSNKLPARNHHFMSVIYPVRPGSQPPLIQRLDDYSVAVSSGGKQDIISFDPKSKHDPTLHVRAVPLFHGPRRPENLRVQQ